jgi:hypothetical protein
VEATTSIYHEAQVVTLPPNSTHILQPCEQFVIANLKQGWKDGRNAFNEELGMNVDISQATILDTAKSVPCMRGRAYALRFETFPLKQSKSLVTCQVFRLLYGRRRAKTAQRTSKASWPPPTAGCRSCPKACCMPLSSTAAAPQASDSGRCEKTLTAASARDEAAAATGPATQPAQPRAEAASPRNRGGRPNAATAAASSSVGKQNIQHMFRKHLDRRNTSGGVAVVMETAATCR